MFGLKFALSLQAMTKWKKYSYTWITAILFILSLAAHWGFAWGAYARDEREKGHQPEAYGYFIETARDTFENWQSEFLQLIWQVAGLAFLLHVGSAQSKEGEERLEAKVDFLILHLAPAEAERISKQLEQIYPKK